MANDPVEELHKYLATAAAVGERLQHTGDQLGNEEKEFDELEHQLESHGEGFAREAHDFNEHVVQEGAQLQKEIQALVQHLRDTWANELQQGVQQVEHEEQETAQVVSQVEQQLHDHHNQLQEQGFELVRQGHDQVTQSVQELEQTTGQAFADLKHGVGEMVSTAHTLHQDTVNQFQDSVSHLTGHVTETVHNAFGEMKNAVEQTGSAVASTFGELENGFTHVYGALGTTVKDVGSHLMHTGEEVFTDMVNYTKDHAVEGVKHEVEKAVGDAIQGLITEFGESIAMMGVGAATTTAISPFVPELVVAKNVAKVANEIIEAMSFGLG